MKGLNLMIISTKEFGNGEFTLENITRGDHITFRLKTRKKSKQPYWVGKRIFGLFVGFDNTSSYVDFAHLDGENLIGWRNSFSVQKKNPKTGVSFTLDELLAIVRFIMKEGKFGAVHSLGETVEKTFSHNGMEYSLKRSCKCMKCNRLLTNPRSIEDGIGPECIKY